MPASTLPYVVRLPIDGGLWLKVKDSWPRAARVYCQPCEPLREADLQIVERVGVRACVRRGIAIDLLLARGNNKRSQFVSTTFRGTLDDFASSLTDASLNYAMAELALLPAAAVVVEGTYSALLRHSHTPSGYLADLTARLQIRYPGVPIVFAESRKLAEEWTFRFLKAALAHHTGPELNLPPVQTSPKTRRPRKAR